MMDANGENMDKRLQKETHALEHTIAVLWHLHAQFENRYLILTILINFIAGLLILNLLFSR